MKTRHNIIIGSFTLTALALCSCTNVKSSLGLEKDAPDEFAVVTRAPLEIPDNLVLPPPNPGMPRPQEDSTIEQAQKALLGEKSIKTQSQTSAAESALLTKTNANNATPEIRALINKETAELHDRNKPVAEKLLNIGGDRDEASATVVDATKEAERIKQNWESGKNILDGDTPTIEE